MTPTLSQICSLHSSFEADVADYAAGGCRSLEVWFTKLESFLEANSVEAVRELLDGHEMATPVASFQGGLLVSQGEQRQEAWELFDRRLQLCRAVRIPTLVVACDVRPPLGSQDLDRVRMSLAEASRQAAGYDVRIALEFQAAAAIGNNLQTALALVEETGQPNLGICLDLFHFYVGPSKLTDLGGLTAENLFHVQLCDLADVPRELAADRHRILPGEGDIPLEPVLRHLQQIRYVGPISLELMNPQMWQVPARQFGEIALTALRRLLGQASMD